MAEADTGINMLLKISALKKNNLKSQHKERATASSSSPLGTNTPPPSSSPTVAEHRARATLGLSTKGWGRAAAWESLPVPYLLVLHGYGWTWPPLFSSFPWSQEELRQQSSKPSASPSSGNEKDLTTTLDGGWGFPLRIPRCWDSSGFFFPML